MSYWKYDISGPGCAAICVAIVGLCFLEAWIFQLLWNWIVPISGQQLLFLHIGKHLEPVY